MPSILMTFDWNRFLESFLYRKTILYDLGLKLFYYGPYLIVFAGGVRLWRLRRWIRGSGRRLAYLTELALYLHAAALIATLVRPVDWVHVAVLYWPFLCLMVLYAYAVLRDRRRATRIALAIGAIPAICLVVYSALLGWQLRTHFSKSLELERAGIYVTPDDEDVMRSAVEYAVRHSEPGQPFPVLPYYPLISFLADRPAPHRSAWAFWPVDYYPTRQQEVIASIEASQTDHMVYHFSQLTQHPSVQEFAPELYGYLVDTFEIDRVFSVRGLGHMMAGLRRSSRATVGRPLVETDSRKLKLWIETQTGAAHAIPPRRRDHFFKTDSWPFRPVMALRPSLRGRRTVLAVPVEARERTRLRTAIGVNPALWWRDPPSWVTFAIRAGGGGAPTTLFSRTLDPHRDREDRGWFGVELPLEAFSGVPLVLEFATECEHVNGAVLEMGGWDIPRLVLAGE
jgi:hypothetical protein